MTKDFRYKCVDCGADAEALCEGSTPDTIEMKECHNCGKTLDHYLEYDTVIVILDIVLMTKQAYRHILFNTKFERYWKMAVLIILVEGFFDWSSLCNIKTSPSDVIIFDEKVYGTFLLQMSFFCFLSAFEYAVFMCFIMLVLHCYWTMWPSKRPPSFSHKTLWKGIILASFQQFFLVATIIWQMFHSEPHLRAIQAFHFFSVTLALSVVCYTSWATSAAIVASGAACKMLLRHLAMNSIVGDVTCDPADVCAALTM